jgi:DNA-binding MarR family transcriptional regulator
VTTEPRWLDDRQQRAWRSYLLMQAHLPARLNRELQADSELSLADFDVLVHLTDVPDARARVYEIAQALQWERSRLSHHLKRMEARSLVVREECREDGRGALVVLTDAGRRAIEQAAPGHVEVVRRLMLDALTDDEVDALGRIAKKVLGRLAADPQA